MKSHSSADAFLEALRENDSRRSTAERKTRQLCRQIQRVLNLALAESAILEGVYIDEVRQAPGCPQMLVYVMTPPGQSVAEAIAALRRDAGRLRAEVAGAIARKRAPELCFVPVQEEEVGYE